MRNNPRRYTTLSLLLDSLETKLGFHGTVLLTEGSDTLLWEGYGFSDIPNKVPTDRQTAYNLASVTKTVTAMGILKLAEAGRLSLQDPVRRFFPDAPADKAAITLHQLLSHQSGIGQHYAADGEEKREKAVRKILNLPLSEAPGKW